MSALEDIGIKQAAVPRHAMANGLVSDARWIGCHGIGRFADEVLSRLPHHTQLENGPSVVSAADPFWLTYQVLAKRPRVFFSPGFNPPLVCPAPFVFTIHDLIQIKVPEVVTLQKCLYYRMIVKRAATRAYRVLTVSNYCREQIARWCGIPIERVVNVGNGVSSVFRRQGPKYEPAFPYILYVGSHRPHKNLLRLIQAFRKIDFPGLHLLLTGTAEHELMTCLKNAGIKQRVRFLGCLPDEKLAAVYRGALLLVLPSISEGFGLPAAEAMACGTPVVVSRSTALPEVVGTAGILIDPFDTDDIRRGLERVLDDSTLRLTMRKFGLERARQFSWDQVAERVRTVLEEAGNAELG